MEWIASIVCALTSAEQVLVQNSPNAHACAKEKEMMVKNYETNLYVKMVKAQSNLSSGGYHRYQKVCLFRAIC